METDRPPACYFTWVEDGKQEIYLEWPKHVAMQIHIRTYDSYTIIVYKNHSSY